MNITRSKDSLALATNLIGIPYLINGKSPTGFDCWGLVWYFYSKIGNKISKPTDHENRKTSSQKDKVFNKTIISNKFIKIKKPVDNCVVSFSINDYTVHVGIWIESQNKCLHSCMKSGVVLESLSNIKIRKGLTYNFYLWQK